MNTTNDTNMTAAQRAGRTNHERRQREKEQFRERLQDKERALAICRQIRDDDGAAAADRLQALELLLGLDRQYTDDDHQKGGEIMNHDEVVINEIAKYVNLLRIEKSKDRDAELRNQKRESRVKLESLGVNVEILEIE